MLSRSQQSRVRRSLAELRREDPFLDRLELRPALDGDGQAIGQLAIKGGLRREIDDLRRRIGVQTELGVESGQGDAVGRPGGDLLLLEHVRSVCETARRPMFTWDVADGFTPTVGPRARDALTALEQVEQCPEIGRAHV